MIIRHNGFTQLTVLFGLLLTAVALPAVSYLAQNSQDNRNRASYDCSQLSKPPSETCNYGWSCNSQAGLWECNRPTPASITAPSPTQFSVDLVGTVIPTPTPYMIDLVGQGYLIPTNTPMPLATKVQSKIIVKPNPTVNAKKRGVFRLFFK